MSAPALPQMPAPSYALTGSLVVPQGPGWQGPPGPPGPQLGPGGQDLPDSVPGPPIPVYAPTQIHERNSVIVNPNSIIPDADGEAIAETFQLGDEASNIYGTWRIPWGPNSWSKPQERIEQEPEPEVPDNQMLVDMADAVSPSWKEQQNIARQEQQFIALLDSLETRVDLMSQMQETRNAISQMPTSPASPYPSPQKSSPVGDLLDITQKMSPEYPDFSELSTNLHPADWVAPRLVMPFTRDLCGTNLQISEEGYRAARIRGCRQSVAIGSAPLQITQEGRYFEILIEETVPGWVGGLGVGVAQSPLKSLTSCAMRRLPDKAWRIPKTSVVGYWGCVFLNGSEYRTSWHADRLRDGEKVGFLVTNAGDILVFVDGEAVVHIERAISQEDLREPMHPIVDVFAATRVVSLSPSASPPPRPWVVTPAQSL